MPWERINAAPSGLQISHLYDAELLFYVEVYKQSHSLQWDCLPHLKVRLAKMLSSTEVRTNYALRTSQDYPDSSMSFLTGLQGIAARHLGTNQVVSLAKPGPATSRAGCVHTTYFCTAVETTWHDGQQLHGTVSMHSAPHTGRFFTGARLDDRCYSEHTQNVFILNKLSLS